MRGPSPYERALERALLACLVLHAVAMVVMALVLLPMMPGSGVPDAARALAIAQHPLRFRLGWLPWQLCAVSDLWLAIALVRAPSVPRAPAIACLLLTALAVAPDQYAQAVWITRGVGLARQAHTPEGLAAYLAFEGPTFALTAGWGALGYTLAGLAWTACFRGAGAWSRALTLLSFPLWALMLALSIGALLPPALAPPSALLAAGNALGFTLLELWLALVCERLLRRRRPDEAHGRWAPYRHPTRGPLGWLAEVVANSRLLRALLERLPVLAMRSDISQVLYISYLVPAERLAKLVPPGLELQRLGPGGAYGLFTFLSYRHGHFGFSLLGPLRRLLPSPLQSNWRVHVRDPRTGLTGITFLTVAIDSAAYALPARLLSEGMPMHVPGRFELTRGGGPLRLVLDPAGGSAPHAEATLEPCAPPALTGAFAACFGDFAGFLAYCVPQDRAFSGQPWEGRIAAHEIELAIPLESCEPLGGRVTSRTAAAIIGAGGEGAEGPLCFRVPATPFRFLRQWRS